MTENKRWNRDDRGSNSKKDEEVHYFRGLSVNEEVQHIFDRTARGKITKILKPIIYVQMHGSTVSHPMDRDELLGTEQLREIQKRKENRKKKNERLERTPRRPQSRDELPEFEPELPPA